MNPAPLSRIPRAVLYAAVLLAGCRSEPISLGLHPVRGQALYAVLATSQTVTEVRDGESYESSQDLTFRWRQLVEELRPDGSSVLALTYEAARLRATSPDLGTLEYDSEDPPSEVPPLAVGMDAAIGETVRLEIGPRGEIRSLPRWNEFVDRVGNKLKLPAGTDPAAARAALRQRFGEETVREMMRPILSIYPDRPVAVGDAWTRSEVVHTPYPHRRETEYELDDVDAETALLRVLSRLTPLEEADAASGGPGPTVAVKGVMRGKLRVDRATGFVLIGDLRQELEGELRYERPGAESVVLPIEIQGRIRYAATP